MKECEICLNKFKTVKGGHTRKYCFECSPPIKKGEGSHKVAIRQAYKKELVKLMGGECFLCGFKGHQAVFDLHHVEPSEKVFSISAQGYTRGWKKVLEEAKKCVLLCKNCHAVHHAKEEELDFSKFQNKKIEERIRFIEEKEKTKQKQDKEKIEKTEFEKKKTQEKEVIEKEVLFKKVAFNGYSKTAREYNVSPTSIRRWISKYDVPVRLEEFRQYYFYKTREENPFEKKKNKKEAFKYILERGGTVKSFNELEDLVLFFQDITFAEEGRIKEGISRVIRGIRKTYLGYSIKKEKI